MSVPAEETRGYDSGTTGQVQPSPENQGDVRKSFYEHKHYEIELAAYRKLENVDALRGRIPRFTNGVPAVIDGTEEQRVGQESSHHSEESRTETTGRSFIDIEYIDGNLVKEKDAILSQHQLERVLQECKDILKVSAENGVLHGDFHAGNVKLRQRYLDMQDCDGSRLVKGDLVIFDFSHAKIKTLSNVQEWETEREFFQVKLGNTFRVFRANRGERFKANQQRLQS